MVFPIKSTLPTRVFSNYQQSKPTEATSINQPATMTGEKTYMDSAKDTLNSVQQKASETMSSVQDTLSGSVRPLAILLA